MSFTLLSVFILLLFGMIAFIEVRNGIKRGLRLSLISLGSSVLSLLLSFPVTLAVAEATAGWLMELLKENEDYENLLAYLPSVELVLPPILSMALCAVLFLAVFLTLLFAVKKIVFLICRKCAKRREDDPGYGEDSPECASRQSRAMGAACGMLAAIVLTVAVLSPLMGILEFADDALNIVKQIDTEIYESLGTGNAEMVHSFTEDPLGKLFYRGAGRAIFNGAASTVFAGKRVYLLEEVDTVSRMAEDMFAVYTMFFDPSQALPECAGSVRRLSENMLELEVFGRLLADALKQCGSAWEDNEPFMILYPPRMSIVIRPIFDEVISACANTNPSNAERNIKSICEVYALTVESGILAADQKDISSLFALLEEQGTLLKIDAVLTENPDMKHIHTGVVAMQLLAVRADADLDGEQKETLASELAQAIVRARASSGGNDDEAAVLLAEILRESVIGENVQISAELASAVAEQLLRDLTGTDVTAEEVANLLDEYKR